MVTTSSSLNCTETSHSQTHSCRSCGGSDLRPVLSLGQTPLANALLSADQLTPLEARYPLDVVLCTACTLVQLVTAIPPHYLFENYVYQSSFSDALVAHGHQSAANILDSKSLSRESLVVEIASNDGYLLKNFVHRGIPVLGIDPARNVAAVAEERGVRTLPRFFSAHLARELVSSGIRADVILANNVMAHIPNINGAMDGIKTLLKADGVFVMETPYVVDLIDHVEFDTIYHEHVFYYSLTALEHLFQRHGLAARIVERIPIHGGSLRVTVSHAEHAGEAPTVRALLEEEKRKGVIDPDYYASFSAQVQALRNVLLQLLSDLKAAGRSLAAYGASAKGSTLLNAFGIGREVLDFVVDRSTTKQGLFTPGTWLPILPPEHLLSAMPTYVLLLTWNFADEILAQQAEFRGRGGRFIVPVPRVTLI